MLQEPYFIVDTLFGIRTTLHDYISFLEELKENIENHGLEEDIQSSNISGTLDKLEKTLIEAIYFLGCLFSLNTHFILLNLCRPNSISGENLETLFLLTFSINQVII